VKLRIVQAPWCSVVRPQGRVCSYPRAAGRMDHLNRLFVIARFMRASQFHFEK
jgi:hypothetical protein